LEAMGSSNGVDQGAHGKFHMPGDCNSKVAPGSDGQENGVASSAHGCGLLLNDTRISEQPLPHGPSEDGKGCITPAVQPGYDSGCDDSKSTAKPKAALASKTRSDSTGSIGSIASLSGSIASAEDSNSAGDNDHGHDDYSDTGTGSGSGSDSGSASGGSVSSTGSCSGRGKKHRRHKPGRSQFAGRVRERWNNKFVFLAVPFCFYFGRSLGRPSVRFVVRVLIMCLVSLYRLFSLSGSLAHTIPSRKLFVTAV
jgi:hypothetical protein